MRGYVTDEKGEQWILPELTAWQLEFTAGVPCDSFWLRCPWTQGGQTSPGSWVEFRAEHEGERVFTGVVDECQAALDSRGSTLEVSGRGMAALLLDNEALGQDYHTATLADILRDHVTPYGIQVAPGANLPAVEQFSVSAGSSEWSVVYEFARYYGGVAPRFDRQGRLVLTGWSDSQERLVEDDAPVTELLCRDKRYGVLSQVLVRDRYSGAVQPVENESFAEAGGRARRVLTMPGRSSYKTMRYSGQFQLDKSAADLERLEVTVAQAFCAWPGDLVRLQRSGWDRNGLYRVAQATVCMDAGGYWTKLDLARVDFMV